MGPTGVRRAPKLQACEVQTVPTTEAGTSLVIIPKHEHDLPECLRIRESSASSQSLDSFPAPTEPSLKELVETTLELHRVSHSTERPRLDEDWLEYQRSYHSL